MGGVQTKEPPVVFWGYGERKGERVGDGFYT
jgi:hypothetical protein